MKRELYDNQLSELPPGVFDNLGSLEYLYVGKKKEKKEKKKKREEGCLILYFPPFVHLCFHPPSFLFVPLVKRRIGGNQFSEVPPGLFDNLGSLIWLYVGKKKKEKKNREEGCFILYFPHFSHHFLHFPLVSFCSSHEQESLQ